MSGITEKKGAAVNIRRQENSKLVLTLQGRLDWRSVGNIWRKAIHTINEAKPETLVINAEKVTYCDGSGIGLLFELKIHACKRDCKASLEGLKPQFENLLDIFDPEDFKDRHGHHNHHINLAEEVGKDTAHLWHDFKVQVSFVGELFAAMLMALLKPWRIRWKDTLLVAEHAGANAVGIICTLGFLFGLILAYSSAMPLRNFGVEVYISDLAAISIVRVLGPFLTAIILAGRTGSAFAAEIGTMKVNDEIDALSTMGLDPVRFLVIPRVIATTFVTPLLAMLVNISGIIGAGVVMLSLGFPLVTYTTHVKSALDTPDLMSGLSKAVVFGALIGSVGCLRGLQTETGASAVGISTTRAVVSGIALVVIAEGIFAVLFHYTGI